MIMETGSTEDRAARVILRFMRRVVGELGFHVCANKTVKIYLESGVVNQNASIAEVKKFLSLPEHSRIIHKSAMQIYKLCRKDCRKKQRLVGLLLPAIC